MKSLIKQAVTLKRKGRRSASRENGATVQVWNAVRRMVNHGQPPGKSVMKKVTNGGEDKSVLKNDIHMKEICHINYF